MRKTNLLGSWLAFGLAALAVPWLNADALGETFRAEMKLQFREPDSRIIEKCYLNAKEAQETLIRSSIVLSPVLERPEIAGLESLRNEKEPRNWLSSHLKADFEDSDVLVVSLTGSVKSELVPILAAVWDAYFQEIVQVERALQTQEFALLKADFAEIEKEIEIHKKRTEAIGKRREIGSLSDSEANALALGLRELARLQKTRQKMREKIDLWERWFQAPPRVQVLLEPELLKN